jgi:hypothetical protein
MQTVYAQELIWINKFMVTMGSLSFMQFSKQLFHMEKTFRIQALLRRWERIPADFFVKV